MDNQQGPNNNNGDKRNDKNGQMLLMLIVVTLVALFIMSLVTRLETSSMSKEISYTEFLNMINEDKVAAVEFASQQINITPKTEKGSISLTTYYTGYVNDSELLPLLKEKDIDIRATIPDNTSTWVYNILSFVIPLVLVWILLGFLMKRMGGGGMMGVGKSNAKVYVEKSTGVTFKDVAGQDEAKESLQEVVDFLHNPGKYTQIGAKLPKGALLVGPPGTGKTLLAKAVAGEAGVPFFSLAGSDFVEMFVGVGASRVRDLCPEVLDKALLRPGRFDRRIIVDKPDLKGRLETLKVHSKDVLMADDVDLDALALASAGLVGSDLANMINEAAINAVKKGRKFVTQADLFEAFEIVAVGGKEKKDRAMSDKEKKIVSYHEVGHAMVTALQKNTEPVQKITIVPRTMGALGYTLQTPEEEKFLQTKEELEAKIVTYMAGRAAEEIVFHSVTSGAANDIEQATKIARAMITQFGMSEKFGMMSLASVENQYLDGRAALNCGEQTASQIDQEVLQMINHSYEEAKRLLNENREVLDKIAEYLYEHETITGKEFMKIFRELKGIPEPGQETEAAVSDDMFVDDEV